MPDSDARDGLPELQQVERLIRRSQGLRADQLAGLHPSHQQLAGGGVRIPERELGQRGLVKLNESARPRRAAAQPVDVELYRTSMR